MSIQAALSALPWARRVWRVMPPALRIPVLLVAAGVGIWYAVQGREELQEADEPER